MTDQYMFRQSALKPPSCQRPVGPPQTKHAFFSKSPRPSAERSFEKKKFIIQRRRGTVFND